MAAGKQDTRQKMINMMYLVFIAMLALNISKEVLATLGLINDDIATATRDLVMDSNENTACSVIIVTMIIIRLLPKAHLKFRL